MMTYEHQNWDVTHVTDVTTGAQPRFRRPEWVAHVLDEEADPPRAVLLHLPSGRRTGLSETATRVWQEIVAAGRGGIPVGGIAAIVAPEYGTDPTIITHDIIALLDEMVAGEWVEIVPEHDGGGQG
jgi:hypothetical protein